MRDIKPCNDFFCSAAGCYPTGYCFPSDNGGLDHPFARQIQAGEIEGSLKVCPNAHRKWPTPDQYYDEYRKRIPKDFPVWFIVPDGDNFPDRCLMPYADALQYEHEEQEWADFEPEIHIVCACTEWDKPSKEWRPPK